MDEFDLRKAQDILEIIKNWRERPEIKQNLFQANEAATNSLMGLIITGTAIGFFPNIPEFNQFLLDKLRIAFEMGYYFHAMKPNGEKI